jgi:hypothetical protein
VLQIAENLQLGANLVAAERLRRHRRHSRRGRRVCHHDIAWQAAAYSLLQGYPNKPAGETRVRLLELDLLRRDAADRDDRAAFYVSPDHVETKRASRVAPEIAAVHNRNIDRRAATVRAGRNAYRTRATRRRHVGRALASGYVASERHLHSLLVPRRASRWRSRRRRLARADVPARPVRP